ncbi:MAG: thiopurine S-methyltransferase [Pseudomonadota bacterium]
MDEQFWHERWENNQIGFHEDRVNTHLEAYWHELGLARGTKVFVPLCGKARDLLWLRAQGHEVLGIEVSAIAVRDFFAENDLRPTVTECAIGERWSVDGLTIIRGDFFDLDSEETEGCAGVFDRASLIALPPPMRRDYAAHLKRILPVWAETLLVTLDYPPEEMNGPPFSVTETEVRALYGDTWTIQRLWQADALEENRKFRERGVTRLLETVYRLSPR